MKDGDKRRELLIETLKNSKEPVSGGSLAQILGVSRQVVVQDIALLRARDMHILATSRGYLITYRDKEKFYRSFYVCHTDAEIFDELCIIIDNGGKVIDTIVEHEIYGQIIAEMSIENRLDIEDFCKKIEQSKSKPLNILADGYHLHTVEASSEVILDNIEKALLVKGYLIS